MTRSIGLSEEIVGYINAHNAPEHPAMTRCRIEVEASNPSLAWYQVSPEQAAFMMMIVRLMRATAILEVGTFHGYSAMAFALAASEVSSTGAKVVTFEKDADWCNSARRHFQSSGLDQYIEVVQGDAAVELANFAAAHGNVFDLCFIDADKSNTQKYIDECHRVLRPGGLILVDNVLWDGKVLNECADRDTEALKKCARQARLDKRFTSTICSVGDGLLMLLKRE